MILLSGGPKGGEYVTEDMADQVLISLGPDLDDNPETENENWEEYLEFQVEDGKVLYKTTEEFFAIYFKFIPNEVSEELSVESSKEEIVNE